MNNPLKIPAQKKRQLELFRHYSNGLRGLHQLKHIYWQISSKNNLSDFQCNDNSIDQKEDLSPDIFLSQLKQLSNKYNPSGIFILIGGGEPLMVDNLCFYGEEITRLGFKWGIETNGMLLTQNKLQDLCKAGMAQIVLPIDGLEQNHNFLRNNPDAFIGVLQALGFAARQARLIIQAHTTVNHFNVNDLTYIKDLLIKHGTHEWIIDSLNPNSIPLVPEDLLPDREDFTALLEFIKTSRENSEMRINLGCDGFLGSYENEVRDGFFFCPSGIERAAVLADGSVTGCQHMGHSFIQANLLQEDFIDIWEKRFIVMRDRSWTKTGICRFCSFHKYCLGSGLHLWDQNQIKLSQCHLSLLTGKDSF